MDSLRPSVSHFNLDFAGVINILIKHSQKGGGEPTDTIKITQPLKKNLKYLVNIKVSSKARLGFTVTLNYIMYDSVRKL